MFQAFADTFLPKSETTSQVMPPAPGSPGQSRSPSRTKQSASPPRPDLSRGSSDADSARQQELIASLQNEILQKDAAIAALTAKLNRTEGTPERDTSGKHGGESIVPRKHHLTPMQHIIHDKGRMEARLGTRGSLLTSNILASMAEEDTTSDGKQIAKRFLSVFQNPVEYFTYLQSPDFASDLVCVCEEASAILEEEPRCLFLQSPIYVFGDVHGNLEDLHFFADNIWKLGIDLTAGHFLFLGDYVDRGLNCLEVVAYMFALKILFPKKVHLLRGNHETRDVNGWEEHYGDRSFLYQCKVYNL